MTAINTNLGALQAMNDLQRSNATLSTALERLSSGLKINRAADNPAGLIISELLRTQQASLSQAISNTERATNVIATAEGALTEVNTLLRSIRTLTVEAASSGSLTPDEIAANQLQIDSAVASVTRIANATAFGDLNLLNGALDYTVSGVTASEIVDLTVNQATIGASALTLKVVVTDSATQATVGGIWTVTARTLEIAGNVGSEVFAFGASATLSQAVYAINQRSDATGVSAAASGTTALIMTAAEYGSEGFVSVDVLHGSLTMSAGSYATGTDAEGHVSGFSAVGRGNVLSVNAPGLDVDLTVAAGFSGSSTFYVTGGGAQFQLGSEINSIQSINIGIQSTTAGRLGSEVGKLSDIITGGAYSLVSGNAATAAEIIDAAIADVSNLRGRLGAFQLNTLETNTNSLRVSLQNVTASESTIRDADFAVETSNLTRAQILVNAGISVLGMANTTPTNVLGLLR